MEKSRTFRELMHMSQTVAIAFDSIERRPWTIETMMVELMKQVGDLAKHILVAERFYLPDRDENPEYRTTMDDVANELADILHAVIRVALNYEIDLESARVNARRSEMRYIGKQPDF